MSTKQEFADWKSHPITKAVFDALKQREAEIVETMALSAGLDPAQDRFHAGYIAAVRDVYLTSAEDTQIND